MKQLKLANVHKNCVSCGSCLPICPKDAITIPHGIIATVNASGCVGCGKCTYVCPAGAITLIERGESYGTDKK